MSYELIWQIAKEKGSRGRGVKGEKGSSFFASNLKPLQPICDVQNFKT